MYCKNCGARIPDGAEFCAACGAHVQQTAARPQSGYGLSVPPRRNSNGIIIAVIALIAVVAVAAIVCFTVLTRGKQQAQMAAIQAEQQAVQAAGQTNDEQTETKEETKSEKEESKESESTTETTVNNYYYYNTTNHTDDYYSKVKSSGYLWPTDTQYISSSDLTGLGQDTVAAIRNEIYARHGYAFTTERWQNYFANKSWYVRDSSCTESTVTARLNSIEKANVNTIVAYEESMGWR